MATLSAISQTESTHLIKTLDRLLINLYLDGIVVSHGKIRRTG